METDGRLTDCAFISDYFESSIVRLIGILTGGIYIYEVDSIYPTTPQPQTHLRLKDIYQDSDFGLG